MSAPTLAPAPGPPQASRRESLGSAAVLLAAVAIAGEVAINRSYTPDGLARLVAFSVVALAGMLLGGARRRPPTWAVVTAGLLAVLALAMASPMSNVVSDSWLRTGTLMVAAATAVPAVLALARPVHAGRVAAAALAVATAGFGLVVLGSRPIIDVWVLLQGSARGLAAGRNPYELAFPFSPEGQVDDCFTYLPGTVLLSGPGLWLQGDVRYAELALLVAAAAAVAWQVRRRAGARLALAVLVALVPGSLHVVQQSWTEPLLLVLLVATAVLADQGRMLLAAAAFGLALATKQHVVLLAPLLLLWRFRPRDLAVVAGAAAAVTVPFLLWNPARFRACTVDFFLDAAPRTDSLSLWLHVPGALALPLLAAFTVAGHLVAWYACPRTGGGFLLASAVVLLAFGLMNKQTFLNQWWLVAALAVAGLAMAGAPRASPAVQDRGEQDAVESAERPPGG